MSSVSHDSSFHLHSVSVVVTAEHHNPSILDGGFLVAQGIVPEDWETAGSITTPNVSVVEYQNGIRWIVDQQNLTITEPCQSSFQDDYLVHKLARVYLKKLPHVPYLHLGLNCTISVNQDEPAKWITKRFLNPEITIQSNIKVLGLSPTISLEAGEAVLNLNFSDAKVRRNDESPEISLDAVRIDCNLHHQGPLSVDVLCSSISRWLEHQKFIIATIDNLLSEA